VPPGLPFPPSSVPGHRFLRRPSVFLLLLLLGALGCSSGGSRTLHAPAADLPSSPARAGGEERVRVIILHDNDTHFHGNHTAETQAFIEEMRSWGDPLFLLNAGDIVVREPARWAGGPHPEWYLRRGLEMIDRMNLLGYDGAVLGNHELDVQGDLTRQILEHARFPFIAGNIRNRTDLLPPLPAYIHLETHDGLRIAVLGLSVINFEPVEGIEQAGFLETARSYAWLREEANALILLTHIGIRDDLDLASDFPDADLIIGGHTNTLLPEPVVVNGVMVAQAGGQAHFFDPDRRMFMGVVVLEFEGGTLVDRCGWVVRIGPGGPEPAGVMHHSGESWKGRPACPTR